MMQFGGQLDTQCDGSPLILSTGSGDWTQPDSIQASFGRGWGEQCRPEIRLETPWAGDQRFMRAGGGRRGARRWSTICKTGDYEVYFVSASSQPLARHADFFLFAARVDSARRPRYGGNFAHRDRLSWSPRSINRNVPAAKPEEAAAKARNWMRCCMRRATRMANIAPIQPLEPFT